MNARSLFLLILSLPVAVFTQPAGYTEIPFRGLPSERSCYIGTGVYDAEKLNEAAAKDPDCVSESKRLLNEASTHTVVRWSAHSDCHMQVAIKVFRNDIDKRYKFVLNNIYGGCRAGGSRNGWTIFEKMPAGYELEFAEVRVDRIQRPGEFDRDGFFFPKPPAPVLTQPIAVREVDLRGCLPLSGQSQWVLRDKAAVFDAFAEKDKKGCASVIESLGIDFANDMLVGYSFASGECQRPVGLEIEAVSELSTDPGKNRFLVTVTYEKTRGACHIWRTHPVWMVMPILPKGTSIAFEHRPRPR